MSCTIMFNAYQFGAFRTMHDSTNAVTVNAILADENLMRVVLDNSCVLFNEIAQQDLSVINLSQYLEQRTGMVSKVTHYLNELWFNKLGYPPSYSEISNAIMDVIAACRFVVNDLTTAICNNLQFKPMVTSIAIAGNVGTVWLT